MQFRTFIIENELNKRDTLLRLNSGSEQDRINVVNKFGEIAERIVYFDPSAQLEYHNSGLLESGE